MFQIGLAVEGRWKDWMVTLATGWGILTLPWWRNLAGIIAQGAPGLRRYGFVLLGFFLTAQFADLDGARKSLAGANLSANPGRIVKKSRAGLLNGSAQEAGAFARSAQAFAQSQKGGCRPKV